MLTGVAGWPVAHSRSPAMHNAAFRELGLADWLYVRLPVAPDLFAEVVGALGASGYAGINVTIPHKQAALAIADNASDAAAQIGAANTLTFGDGIEADNTDAQGFLDALDMPVAGRTALVLGAGGAGRAVAWALRTSASAPLRRPRRPRSSSTRHRSGSAAPPATCRWRTCPMRRSSPTWCTAPTQPRCLHGRLHGGCDWWTV